MEVSSHALEQQRVYGVPFDVAVFTNLTRDHLDYHGNMEEYFASKTILFQGSGTEPPRVAVINVEDEYGQRLLGLCKKQTELITYGIDTGDFHARNVSIENTGVRFDLVTPQGEIPIWSPLLGRVNVYNLIAASAAAYARDVEPRQPLPKRLGSLHVCRGALSAWMRASPSRSSWTMLTPMTRCAISLPWRGIFWANAEATDA